jgi:hypothetical protein
MASLAGPDLGKVWAERAVAALLQEQGQSALEQARLERAASKRARRQKRSVLEAGRCVAVGLNQPRWFTHHASCWSLA